VIKINLSKLRRGKAGFLIFTTIETLFATPTMACLKYAMIMFTGNINIYFVQAIVVVKLNID